jgi:hypothetical protein
MADNSISNIFSFWILPLIKKWTQRHFTTNNYEHQYNSHHKIGTSHQIAQNNVPNRLNNLLLFLSEIISKWIIIQLLATTLIIPHQRLSPQQNIPSLHQMNNSQCSSLSIDLLASPSSNEFNSIVKGTPNSSIISNSLPSRHFFTRSLSIADDETTVCPSIPDHISFASLDDLTVQSGLTVEGIPTPQLRIIINHNKMAPSGGMEDAARTPVQFDHLINKLIMELDSAEALLFHYMKHWKIEGSEDLIHEKRAAEVVKVPEEIIETTVNETSFEDFEEAHEHFNDTRDAQDNVDESDGSYDARGHGQAMNF